MIMLHFCKTLFLCFTISCKQKCSVTLKMHQIRFSPWLCLGPRWGSSLKLSSWLRRKIPFPILHLFDAYSAWFSFELGKKTCSKDL